MVVGVAQLINKSDGNSFDDNDDRLFEVEQLTSTII